MNSRQVVVITGNVGSGKSTMLSKLHAEAEQAVPGSSILILEPIDEWKEPLEAFKASGKVEDQLVLQREVSKFAKTVYNLLKENPEKNFFIERSVQEHIAIFLDKDRLGEENYWSLVSFYQKWNFDTFITKNILLDVSVEECYRRITRRGQHGDAGTSREYLEFLHGKYQNLFKVLEETPSRHCGIDNIVSQNGVNTIISRISFSRPKSIAFIGNIGSGKTTSINFVKASLELLGIPTRMFKERLDIWGKDLEAFKASRNPESLTTLQCKIAECAREVYEALASPEPNVIYLIERTVQENIMVFVKPHLDSGFLTEEQYCSIVNVWKKWDYDSLVETFGYLETSPEVCHERVTARGQEGDSTITLEYLQSLETLYKELLSKRVYYERRDANIPALALIPHFHLLSPSKVIAFTGNIGAGKSTAIRKAAAAYPDSVTLLEPVAEWGEDLCRFKETGSVADLIKLQKNICSFSRKVWGTLRGSPKIGKEGKPSPWAHNKPWYFIERTNHEHLEIFCRPSLDSGFLTQEEFDEATSDYREFNFDTLLTEVLFFDVPHEECYRRVASRGQEGDSSIDPEYIKYLAGLYEKLYCDKDLTTGSLQRVIGAHKSLKP